VEVRQCRRHKHVDPLQKMIFQNAIIEGGVRRTAWLDHVIARFSVTDALSKRNYRSALFSTPLSTASIRCGSAVGLPSKSRPKNPYSFTITWRTGRASLR
jgi:hypothetical protein